MLLKDKVALIIGGTSGMGKAGARAFLGEGANVTIVGRDASKGRNALSEINNESSKGTFIRADSSRVSDIERVVKTVADTHGHIDIFWHHAGTLFPGHIENVTEEHFDYEIAVGVKAALFGTKLVLPFMKNTGGNILFTGSMVGLRPSPYSEGYSISYGVNKAAMIMLTRSLVEPLARYNIRVNCLCPGPVSTEKWEQNKILQAKTAGVDVATYREAHLQRVPFKRAITEAEAIEAALFLVSDKASGITGVALPVDGGFSAL
jgi:NAD(P)-dependent dehydrogenase (short-subunit alcohol dehydrogenase family)